MQWTDPSTAQEFTADWLDPSTAQEVTADGPRGVADSEDVECVVGMVHGQPHVIQRSQFKTASEYMYCLQWSRLVVEDARRANVDMNEDWDMREL